MNDFGRYDRQIQLSDIGEEGQKLLKSASVLIVGVGGLGCPAVQYLAAAGVGKIGLVDPDMVDPTNLHRQILYTEADVGKPKVVAAKERIERMNGSISIEAYQDAFSVENAISMVSTYDIIVDGTDNFQSKYLLNDACVLANKPLVSASIYRHEGQLSVFNFQGGPSYRCLFPKHHFIANSNCEDTGVLGVAPGILGTMQATEVLKMVLGIGTVLSGRLLMLDLLAMNTTYISFQRNDDAIKRVKNRPLQLEIIECHLSNSSTMYLDVREYYEQPRVLNTRLLTIPFTDLSKRCEEIPKTEEVHVFCATGMRSKKAISLLEKAYGFNNLVDAGGIENILK